MNPEYRVGILGFGFMGQAHLLALRQIPGVTVSVIVDRTTTKAQEKAQYWHIPHWTTDWSTVIVDSKVDVIHNCLPNKDHFLVLKAAIEANRPIFTEKPLTRTMDEADKLKRLILHPSVPKIGVNFNYRAYPMIEEMRQWVTHDKIGPVTMVQGTYLQDWLSSRQISNWRLNPQMGGPSRAMADIGSHLADLVEYVVHDNIHELWASFGQYPTVMSSDEVDGAHPDTDDFGWVMFKTTHGIQGSLTISQVAPGFKNDMQLTVVGTKCSLRWEQSQPDSLWIGETGSMNTILLRGGLPNLGSTPTALPYPAGHLIGWPTTLKSSINAFYENLRLSNQEGYSPGVAEGLHNMDIIHAALTSRDTRQWVTVGSIKEHSD
jgi:predicted dehydrogenase